MPKARIFFIMQYCKHPVTGETLLTQEKIEEALDHATIKRWAWVLHDKDIWDDYDELDDPSHVSGQPKPPHYHIAIDMPRNSTEVETIAKWFGIPMNFVEMKRGRNAFLDCCEYLTHEHPRQQELGKHRYDDEEIHSNFEYRATLDKFHVSRSKYGADITMKEWLRIQVLEGKMTLNQVKEQYKLNYISDKTTLEKLRMEYLQTAKPPLFRHNFYITGGGGVGKGVASVCLAHALFPNYENEDELIFRVGSSETTFMGYDGQPVIIWDDFRSFELLKLLGGRGNVFKVFDTNPVKQRQNVKFSSVNLINSINIVNSVQPYDEFLNGLVGEYTDRNGNHFSAEENEKSQSYRRFPYIIPLRASDFDIMISKGFLYEDGRFDEYLKFQNLKGNFGYIAKKCPEMVTTIKIGSKMLGPLVDQVNQIEAHKKEDGVSEDKLLDEFKDYGKPTTEVVGKAEAQEPEHTEDTSLSDHDAIDVVFNEFEGEQLSIDDLDLGDYIPF